MQTGYKQQSKEVEVIFLEDDMVCPICESYSVEETKIKFLCADCGSTWKTFSLEK